MRVRRHRGFSLVELMVAMAIALVILLAVSMAYVSGLNTQRAQTDTTRLNETARFAFDVITRAAKKSGFRNTWQYGSTASAFCSSTATGGQVLATNDPNSINPLAADFLGGTQKLVENKSDVLRIRFYGEDTAATAALTDCQGYLVAPNLLVEETLYVRKDPNNGNEPSLYCYVSNNPANPNSGNADAMPLVAGVESLQFLYGEDTEGDGVINRYVPWNLVTNADNILGIKASLVVRSPNAVASDATALTFNHFGVSYTPVANSDSGAVFAAPTVNGAGDRRLRLQLSTEVAMRNFRWCN